MCVASNRLKKKGSEIGFDRFKFIRDVYVIILINFIIVCVCIVGVVFYRCHCQ